MTNKINESLSMEEMRKVNPRITSHEFFREAVICESSADRFYGKVFNGLSDSEDLVFRVQLLELYIFGEETECLNDRSKSVILSVREMLNPICLRDFEVDVGFGEFQNLVDLAQYPEVRSFLSGMRLKDLRKISRLELDDSLGEEAIDVLRYFLSYKKNKAQLAVMTKSIDEFLVEFSDTYVKSKIFKNIEGREVVLEPLEDELTFVEDVLLLLDGFEQLFTDESLIVERFLRSSKNREGFLQNHEFKGGVESSIWGLRASLSMLGFENMIEALKIMREKYELISPKHLVRYAKLYSDDKIQPSIGIFISEEDTVSDPRRSTS